MMMSVSDTEREQEFSRKVQKETLITLVEHRPVLWDKTLDIYKDKAAKATAWREICIFLMDNYEEMEPKERHEFGKFVIKKWSQTRDAWIRTLKEEKKCKKSGMPSKPYRYHEQMMFLRKVVLTSEINESSPSKTITKTNERIEKHEQNKCDTEKVTENETTQQINSEPATSLKRKATCEMDEKMKSFIDCHNAVRANTYTPVEDRNYTFFKSLLPSLALLDDDQTLEFQSGVLSLLQSIKRRPAYCDWGRHPHGFYHQPNEDLPQSPSATSMSAQSQSSEVPDLPLQVKIEME